MTKFIYFVGTAGSGKSYLTGSFLQWIEQNSTDYTSVITVNFDPGVLNLSYSPDVDCRDYVNIRRKGEIIRRGNEISIEVGINNNGDFIAKDIY